MGAQNDLDDEQEPMPIQKDSHCTDATRLRFKKPVIVPELLSILDIQSKGKSSTNRQKSIKAVSSVQSKLLTPKR